MTVDIGEYYVICNTYRYDIDQYIEQFGGIKVAKTSHKFGQNVIFYIDQLRDLMTRNLGVTV